MVLQDRLQVVQSAAQREHQYIYDQDQYGVPDYWRAGLTGDCEDYALHVRQQLAAQGIASDLVYCLTERGGGHLVVSVQGWILDNRRKWVTRRDDLPYTWVSLGKPDGTWVAITG